MRPPSEKKCLTVSDLLRKDFDPSLIDFAQSRWGKITLIASFALFLQFLVGSYLWLAIMVGTTACAPAGRYRFHVLALMTFSVLVLNPFWFDWQLPQRVAMREGIREAIPIHWLNYGALASVFCFSTGVIYCNGRFRRRFFSRRPILSLLLFFFALLLIATSGLLHGMPLVLLWSFINALGAYFWFLGYALLDQKANDRSPLLFRFGVFHPFWGSTNVPFGKGMAYLRKVEAKSAFALVVCQMKAVRLLFHCLALKCVLVGFIYATQHMLRIPTFDATFARQLAGTPYPVYVCWGSVVAAFIKTILLLSVMGNTIVACARMAGFQLLRNTYKPLQAQTIAEFWNRYYFYFKELLVEFFFYPTFARCFKRQPRLRILFATFMAACVGNVLYHFIRGIGLVADRGLTGAIVQMQTYAFYSFILALGIGLSQLHSRKNRAPANGIAARLLPSLRVSLFFCFLSVFYASGHQHPLSEHFNFLFHLFGV